MTDVIIIGAGHNGLSCAAYLARAGKKVLVLDAGEVSGGMSATRAFAQHYQVAGLTQTAYPLSKKMRRDLDLENHGYQTGPSIETIVLNAEGQHLTVGRDLKQGATLSKADIQAYPEFMQLYREFAKVLKPFFAAKPPRLKDMDFADKKTLAKLGWDMRVGLGRDSMYEFMRVAAINIYDVLNDTFENEQLKSCLAVDAVMGSAMGPRTPGTVLTWLHRLQGSLNGELSLQTASDSNLVSALYKSAEASGATIHTNSAVKRILIENDRAVGVVLENGESLKADLVVSSVDPRTTFQSLVGCENLDALFANRVTQIRGSGVVAKLNIALSGLPEFTGVDKNKMGSRFIVAPTMRYIEQAFNHSKYGEYSDNPVLEFSLPTSQHNGQAPDGHHILSINVAYAPYCLEGGWQTHKDAFAQKVLSQLKAFSPNLESLMVDYELLTPVDIEQQYGASQGHWHHGELSIHQSMMMRPLYGAAQYNTPIDNLFLCGAGCHPGGDLTGLPGSSAAQRVLELGVIK